jgi:CIC family chloride channel protein
VRLQKGRDVDVMQAVMVGEVMTSGEVHTVSKDTTLVELSDMVSSSLHHGFPVLDEHGKFWGMVTASDLNRAVAREMPRSTKVSKIGVSGERLLVAYPDETVEAALTRMSRRGLGRLPVVSREDPTHLLGLIRRVDIIKAYNLGLTRRAEIQHRTQRLQLRNLDGTEFVELTLSKGDHAVGKTLQNLAEVMPKECVLVSVRRNGRAFIPHGDTKFRPGDHITAFISSREVEKFFECFREAREQVEEKGEEQD